MANGQPDAFVVRQIGSNVIWGVFTVDPEPYFDLFAEVTGYSAGDFYVDHKPLSGMPTKDNIGKTYS